MKTLANYSRVLGITQLCLFVLGLVYISVVPLFGWRTLASVHNYYFAVVGSISWVMTAIWFVLVYRLYEPKQIPFAVLCLSLAVCVVKCLLECNIGLVIGPTAIAVVKWTIEIAFMVSLLWLWSEYQTRTKVYMLMFTILPLVANLCRLWAFHAHMERYIISLFGLIDSVALFAGMAFFIRFGKQCMSSEAN